MGAAAPVQEPLTPIISIKLVDLASGGKAGGGKAFKKPLTLKLGKPSLEDPNAEAQCSYWDDENKVWTPQGLTSRLDENGNLVCETTHLTMFSAIAKNLEKVLL